jgi:hypothetical protein
MSDKPLPLPSVRLFDEADIRLGVEALRQRIAMGPPFDLILAVREILDASGCISSRAEPRTVGFAKKKERKMAHPYKHVARHKASHQRVAHILGHAKPAHRAAPEKKHGGAAGMSDMRIKRSHEGEDDLRAEGGRAKHRYAKGGGVKIKNLNVVHVHKPHPVMPPPGAVPGAPPPAMGGPAPTLAPPGPPGMPPPMRARGGHVMAEHVPEDISEYKPAKMRKAQGGKIKAGAATGVSRLEQAEQMKHRD